MLGAEVDARHFDAVINRGAELLRVLQQHQVELAAIHVVGIVSVFHTFLLPLFETDVDVVFRRARPSRS